MSNRLAAILIIAAALAISLGCSLADLPTTSGAIVRGSGNVVDETREVGEITEVNLATIGTLHIEQGNEVAFRISAEDNLLPLLKTEVRGSTLVIETERNTNIRTTQPIDYYLTVVDLDTVSLSSSGDADAQDLEAKDFTIRVSSSGSFTMEDLTCSTLTARLSSSGKVTIASGTGTELDADLTSSGDLTIDEGAFERQTVRLSSSGSLHARNVRTQQASLTLNSSGNATVWVEDTLDARLSSSGSVRYAGDPALTQNSSSSGVVRPLDD